MELTADQQAAKDAIIKFLSARDSHVFVLKGFAGTGKTTLVKQVLEHIPKADELAKIINPKHRPREVFLTATTHKAAEALSVAADQDVNTIHSHLEIRVHTDYSTGENTLKRKYGAADIEDQIIFIDEASYIDEKLLKMILFATKSSKIVFMGDPTQLTPVGLDHTPVFERGFPEAVLTKVVRQDDGNPIKEISHRLRQFILGEVETFPRFKVDGKHIQRVDRETFDSLVMAEFTNPDWKMKDSKMLAWTNARVNKYNKALRKKATGRPELAKGDYAVNNHHVQVNKEAIKTDATVLITAIEPAVRYGYSGKNIDTDKCRGLFQLDNWADYDKALSEAVEEKNASKVKEIKETWCDLRAAYCCTVNKSQGSTFQKVFIDLDDICRCRDMNQLARMLYVAISRAKSTVILTGDM
ncbi:ATP-dependent DNA helicase [Acinetobacter sp. A47]|uniref:ATP-dependent DNA helicase n=1 Tax=Acinetobacter sp. A47 TaxID=1561217 RepID=UPI00056E9CAC|nr:AAA family ATPase [Acinetobacter sp. A47]